MGHSDGDVPPDVEIACQFLCSEVEFVCTFRTGVKRAVAEGIFQTQPFFGALSHLGGEGPVAEPFPNIVYSRLGRVKHVGAEEAVVTQFVEDDFVGGKVMGNGQTFLSAGADKTVGRKQQCGLAELGTVHSIFGIAVRTYGKDYLERRIDLVQAPEKWQPCPHDLFHGKIALREGGGRFAMAVSDNETAGAQFIDTAGSESDEQNFGLPEQPGGRQQTAEDPAQAFFFFFGRELPVVQPAVPQIVFSPEKIFFVKGTFQQRVYPQTDALGIVENSEGVDDDGRDVLRRLQTGQATAYMFGKA